MPLFSMKKFRGLFSPKAGSIQINSPGSDSQSDSNNSSTNQDQSQPTSSNTIQEAKGTRRVPSKYRNSTDFTSSCSTPKIIISMPPSPAISSSNDGRKGILLNSPFRTKSETCINETATLAVPSRNKSKTQNCPPPTIENGKPHPRKNIKRVTFAKNIQQDQQYINLKFVEKFHEKSAPVSPRESLPSLKPRQGFSSPQVCMQFCPIDGLLPISFTPKAQPVSKQPELKINFLGDDLINRDTPSQNTAKYQIINQMDKTPRTILPIIGSPSRKVQDDLTFGSAAIYSMKQIDGTPSRKNLHSPRHSVCVEMPSFGAQTPTLKQRARASIGPIEINSIQAMRAADQKLESEFLDESSNSRNFARLLIKPRGSIQASN